MILDDINAGLETIHSTRESEKFFGMLSLVGALFLIFFGGDLLMNPRPDLHHS